MKKLNHLLVIEADALLQPLLPRYEEVLKPFSTEPVGVYGLDDLPYRAVFTQPYLVLLHLNLDQASDIDKFRKVHKLFKPSSFIIVGECSNKQVEYAALEEGADDCIREEKLTMDFVQQLAIVSLRRYRTETLLRQKNLASEERYQNLFNQASDAIFINDKEGSLLEMNEQALRLTGRSKRELLKMKISDLYSKEELDRKPIMWDELLSGHRTSLARTLLHANGRQIPIEVTAQLIDGDKIMAIVRDVSERNKAQEALIQSEQKYRTLVEQQADAIAIFNIEGKINDVNGSAVQLLQYSHEELETMNILQILLPGEAEENPIEFHRLKQGESTIKQRKMVRKDGSTITTEVHTKRIFDGVFMASVRDLSERLAVQRQLEKEITLSDSIINSLPGIFYLYQEGKGYMRWNKQLESVSGYSGDEIRSMHPTDFFSTDEKQSVRHAIQEIYETGETVLEAHLFTKEGRKIPYYFTGSYISYDGNQAFLGTAIDFTTIRALENELSHQKIVEQKKIIQAMIEAEEKEKNKLGQELHDNVNQILSVVRMYLGILNSDQVLTGITLSQTINLLDSAIAEIRSLSHSLAVSYKFEGGLRESLESMLAKVQATRGFSIELVTPPDVDSYTTGEQKLAIYRIIQEQLNNINKYAKATEVLVQIYQNADEVGLLIADNGQGFNPSTAKKGLGLNTITNRAEALGGRAAVQSAPGKGCRVSVFLPAQAVAEQ